MNIDIPKYNTQYPNIQFYSPNTNEKNLLTTNTTYTVFNDLPSFYNTLNICINISYITALTSPTTPSIESNIK